jgi:trimeric autotransporter adhesin
VGAMADTLYGHNFHNDVFKVTDSGTIIIENCLDDIDTAQASVSYTLGNNPDNLVENLILTGAASINGAGNDLSNSITGNKAANLLAGGLGQDTITGGAGIDTMLGGGGNDIYFVDNSLDLIQENPGEGIDIVNSTASYTLTDNIEK